MSTPKIPDGQKGRVIPHLVVENGVAAIEFYKKAFAATERYRALAPDGKRLMHAELIVGEATVFLCDDFPEYSGKPSHPNALGASSVTIHQYVEDCDAAVARAKEAGATVRMEPADMFWGDRYASVTDPFGHTWSFATHIRDVSPEELTEAARKAFGG